MHLCPSRLTARRAILSASGRPTRTCAERGWASNAHEAGVPSGWSLGRNLRSKTRWFTGFCNSHHVSHFATFFIDARAEISVAGSHLISFLWPRQMARCRSTAVCLSKHVFLGANPRRVPTPRPARPGRQWLFGAGGAEGAALLDIVSLLVQRSCFQKATTMILPQVHLRKPCYDFSFL
jgi:hypothetical protein